MVTDADLDGDVQALKVDIALRARLSSRMSDPITDDEAAVFSELDQQVNCEMEDLAGRMATQDG